MKTEQSPALDGQIARAFIAHARALLTEDYLLRIERCLATLDETDVWWRANAESNSIGNLLLHLAGNARQWIVSGVGGAPDMRVRDSEFAATDKDELTKAELLARLRATLKEVDQVLARLDTATLLDERTIQNCTGVTILEAVFHVVEHFSMHTGQIILLTKLRTARDLVLYDFTDSIPRKTWGK
ncbi:MAG TPA: DinB family protein, partial [Pyrinomonadaceae bacterium]|nr:DinB family protein [Pyrinomonadaceae bacterium]